jgi:UDP-N-acetyl-D-mannosaminuronic acid transferase (WecB/TagA/CpsF family)
MSGASARVPEGSAPAAVSEAPLLSVDVAGLPVHDVTFDEVVKLIADWVADRSGGTVYTRNVDYVVNALSQSASGDWRA